MNIFDLLISARCSTIVTKLIRLCDVEINMLSLQLLKKILSWLCQCLLTD